MNVNKERNVDTAIVEGFGQEWEHFDQRALSDTERLAMFYEYFAIFPWQSLPSNPIGFDAGCGTGRWAVLVAPRVKHLYCIEPSSAIDVARRNLRNVQNCTFYQSTIDEMPLADGSMDFGYSLGVLHHLPNTPQGFADCVRKLKKGAPFLVYLYYAFDNQPRWFRALWVPVDLLRRIISRLPFGLKYLLTQFIAAVLYYPLARTARILEKCGVKVHSLPLSAYRKRSYYSMRTDAFDRFGTSLEKRFTLGELRAMMEGVGLENIQVSPNVPFWCAVGYKQ